MQEAPSRLYSNVDRAEALIAAQPPPAPPPSADDQLPPIRMNPRPRDTGAYMAPAPARLPDWLDDNRPRRPRYQYVPALSANEPPQSVDPYGPNYVPPPTYAPPPGFVDTHGSYLAGLRQQPSRREAIPAFLLGRGPEVDMPVHPRVAAESSAQDRFEEEERERRARAEGYNRIDWDKYV